MRINLRSDTVTQPSQEMRTYMRNASLGDDAYGEDKSVNQLQNYCKDLFCVEDALFLTSGMLSNRLAIMCQALPGDEVITDYAYHINFFDSAAVARVCNIVLNTRHTHDGILKAEDLNNALYSKPRYEHFAQVRLVSIENTINGWVGRIFPFPELKRLRDYTQKKGIFLHLDGARLFNAHVETKIPLSEYASQVDTLSVCFSKGLGAPFGSMLMGRKDLIDQARKYRMWLGSGFHQAGFQASAAYYALRHHIPRLKEDHEKARLLTYKLSKFDEIKLSPFSGETNMIQFKIEKSEAFLKACEEQSLLLFSWLPGVIRAVVHRNIGEKDILNAAQIIKNVLSSKPFLKKDP